MTPEMYLNEQLEEFSRAYAAAVAAVAGMAWSRPSVDLDSVDLTVTARGLNYEIRGPKVDLQLKCTGHPVLDRGRQWHSLRLRRKNYNDLSPVRVAVPRILVLVCVPPDPGDWVRQSADEMVLRGCGYWVSLRGLTPIEAHSKVVRVPTANIFSPTALDGMMQRIGGGGHP